VDIVNSRIKNPTSKTIDNPFFMRITEAIILTGGMGTRLREAVVSQPIIFSFKKIFNYKKCTFERF
jgi:hypothetical protein